MAKVRKFCAYRRLERPYTRISKYREKSFIKANTSSRIVKFVMGNPTRDFNHTVQLVSKIDCQIRDLAFESGRMTCNRLLETQLGKKLYNFRIRPYPHHILRENPLAAGAGADRMSTGMKHSFGKTIGSAARIKKGQTIMEVKVNKTNLATAKLALKRAGAKLPCRYQLEVLENSKN